VAADPRQNPSSWKIDSAIRIHQQKPMNITFRQLRLFLALADTGSVTAAARACT
jgi:molybdenum-dependent DNA-binding transcriptional regulator ModE